ncbi:hypothetical protein D3C86_1340680 [compost metagenome]
MTMHQAQDSSTTPSITLRLKPRFCVPYVRPKATMMLNDAPVDMVAIPPSTTCFQYLRNTSASGIFTCTSASLTLLKAGVSAMFKRMYKPTAISSTLPRNGIRQPQANRSSGDSQAAINRKARLAIMVPAGTPICTHEPYKPRLLAGACSTAINTAPPHSPPSARP